MVFITLPYFAPHSQLPHPLPTNVEILNSQNILSEYSGRKVVQVGCHFVVKYGTGVNLIEGENMLFVSRSTNILIPKVYAMYSDPGTDMATKVNYIVMENITGNTLACEWPLLSIREKEAITTQLKWLCDQLRNIPSPGYFGSLGKRGLLDPVFWTGNGASSELINGPFETEHSLNETMIQKYVYNNLPVQKAEFYRRMLPSVLVNHDAVFTHGDFQRKNIIVRKATPPNKLCEKITGKEESHDLVLIDWEFSGWYPSYWEFATTVYACGRWDDDWHKCVGSILDPFPNEYAWMQMLRCELWS